MKCKSVLVVDDEDSIRECVSDILEMEGYLVIQARNGYEALEYLKNVAYENLPGVIL